MESRTRVIARIVSSETAAEFPPRDDGIFSPVPVGELLLKGWDSVAEPSAYMCESEHRAVDDFFREKVAAWY